VFTNFLLTFKLNWHLIVQAKYVQRCKKTYYYKCRCSTSPL